MAAVIIYHSLAVEPICRRIARAGDGLIAVRDTDRVPAERVAIRFGSVRPVHSRHEICINTVDAVRLANDKRLARRTLRGLCPRTWERLIDVPAEPVIVRPRRHFAGRNFFLCNTYRDLERAVRRCGPRWYATEYVDKAREFRVFVFQGHVIRVSEKFAGTDGNPAWNIATGGRVTTIKRKKWPIDVVKTAIKAAELVGLQWAAVDLIVGKNGKIYVLELNTAPGITKEKPIQQVADVFSWAAARGVPQDMLDPASSQWQDLIHPALL